MSFSGRTDLRYIASEIMPSKGKKEEKKKGEKEIPGKQKPMSALDMPGVRACTNTRDGWHVAISKDTSFVSCMRFSIYSICLGTFLFRRMLLERNRVWEKGSTNRTKVQCQMCMDVASSAKLCICPINDAPFEMCES